MKNLIECNLKKTSLDLDKIINYLREMLENEFYVSVVKFLSNYMRIFVREGCTQTHLILCRF